MESIVIILLVIGVIVWLWMRKKKKSRKSIVSTRKNKDEVWKVIKEYLKKENKQGMEIVDTYVAKRNKDNYIDPHLSPYLRNKVKAVIDIRNWQNKSKNKQINPSEFSKAQKYVVCFQTKNNKTGIVNKPEAFECTVERVPISKKEFSNKIVINHTCDFEKEMEWIAYARGVELRQNDQQNAKVDLQKYRAERIKLINEERDLLKKQSQANAGK